MSIRNQYINQIQFTSGVHAYLKTELSVLQSMKNIGQGNPRFGKSAVRDLNLKWYNNGIENIYVTEHTEPPEYFSGRIVKWNSARNKEFRSVVSPKDEIFENIKVAAISYFISVNALRERIRRNESNNKIRKNKSYCSYYEEI
jgi:hypothetical protein